MEVMTINHESLILNKQKTLTIIGDIFTENIATKKVVFFLHGLGGDSLTVLYKTQIMEYAKKFNLVIIFPDVDRSFYTNMNLGLKYYDYLTKEVYDFIENTFKLNLCRENTSIMGISMGGYGSFKYILNEPEKFSSVISISGSLDIKSRDLLKRKDENIKREWQAICGDIIEEKEDLFYLAKRCQNRDFKITVLSGKTDYLYKGNVDFVQHLKKLKYEVDFIETQGEHNWETFIEQLKIIFEEINKGEQCL